MNKEYYKDIYNKLQKLYEEMGWFQPISPLEELSDDDVIKEGTISIEIMIPDSNDCQSEGEKNTKKKKNSKKTSKKEKKTH